MHNIASCLNVLGHNPGCMFRPSMVASLARIWGWQSMLYSQKRSDNQYKIKYNISKLGDKMCAYQTYQSYIKMTVMLWDRLFLREKNCLMKVFIELFCFVLFRVSVC